ncbi:hypothetical protein PMAYCL1PPCAC_19832 [Pristionchus mayeri]|uniref:Uncharacterized protein n=1 Tax=Pristionchus mayeri TaxID=1317129 RepID=A0AAN5CS75_9BILA|nr:hypothetical protein PMAYCL1PPCAC_19832 [Pristionchus mayeri]
MDAVAKEIEGLTFNMLTFNVVNDKITQGFANRIIQIIEKHNIDQVIVIADEVEEPAQFLLNLASAARSICISQTCASYWGGEPLFLGAHELSWAPGMFERKMDKLFIDNRLFLEFLDTEDIKMLRERLPKIDKKIWFASTCLIHGLYGLNYENNGCVVQSCISDGNEVERGLISITHSSRQDERFKSLVKLREYHFIPYPALACYIEY